MNYYLQTGEVTVPNGHSVRVYRHRNMENEWINVTKSLDHVYLLAHVDVEFPDSGIGARWSTYNLYKFHVAVRICELLL